jgi:hypothetical protein
VDGRERERPSKRYGERERDINSLVDLDEARDELESIEDD